MRIVAMKKPDTYGSVLVFAVLVLFGLMLGTIYKIKQTKEEVYTAPPVQKQYGFMVPMELRKQEVVILTSKKTAEFYINNGSSAQAYSENIRQFASTIEEIGYKTTILPIDKLNTLDKNALVFVVDAQVLEDKNKKEIRAFVKSGGSLFFNFLAGFTDVSGTYIGETFVKSITHLSLSEKGFASFKEGLSLTPKILSPFSSYLKEGKLLSVALYDKLPIYKSSEKEHVDIYATAYDQVTAPISKKKADSFKNSEAALAWHGYLGKGKWVYTSLPSYSFYDIKKDRDNYKKILAGMISFLSQEVVVEPYPYIDQTSVVFVSEDTEYKFENFQRFSNLSREYQIPVTAFIVANLAALPEHKEMMKQISQNPYVEFASHSTTHKKIVGESEAFVINETENSKKIIDPFAPQAITGFRPPREELNLLMKQHLAASGFTYVLGANASYLYPMEDKEEPRLIYIPRHGTDDYSYLVNLDWNQKEIVHQMKEEAAFVTGLNGIYTLSVHTHLFSYSTNIDIIRAFYEHLKKNPALKPLNGSEIVKRVKAYNHIKLSSKILDNQLIITVKNSAKQAVKNLYLKLFKSPDTKIISGKVSKGLEVTLYEKEDAIMIDTLPASSTVTLYVTLEK